MSATPETSTRMPRQVVVIKAGVVHDGQILVLTPATPSHDKERDLPGGKLEYGEDPLGALRREVLEETALSIIPVRPVRIWSFIEGDGTHFVGITFACRSESSHVQLSGEHVAYLWLSKESIPIEWPERDELLAIIEAADGSAPPISGTSASTS